MTLTGQAAIDEALSRVGGTMPDSGLCLQFTRQCFEIPSYYYSAVDAWYGGEHRQPGDRKPPPAVPVWFDSSSIYEHVAFHCYDGVIVTTFNAEIRRYNSISAVENVFGPYAGWGPGLNEVQVWWPDTPPPPPTEEDDDVKALIYDGGNTWFLFDAYRKRPLAPGEPQTLVDLGLISAQALAAGPKWVSSAYLNSIPTDH